ncbi:hypothetical protein C8R44DRAFT_602882 [Mycena epipterygia]|nr:hypothetical protein C8R44DRAFT_602882 [Mycena epipterygia]
MSTTGVLTGEARRQVNLLLGPWLVGCCLDLLFQGTLLVQFMNYFSWYQDDKGALKAVVGGLFLLTTLKSIQSFVILWIQFIVFFGDVEGAIKLDFTTWWQSGNPLMVAVIGLYVHSYFCYRLYIISGTAYVVAPVAIIFLFAFLSVIIATYYIVANDDTAIGNWCASHLSSVFAGDLILSATTAFFLIRSAGVHPQTIGLMEALIRLTFQTAAPAALCAMFNLIFSLLYTADQALISTAFNMPLPKLYAMSMMWTLNARRRIRALYSAHNGVIDTADIAAGLATSNQLATRSWSGRAGGSNVSSLQRRSDVL